MQHGQREAHISFLLTRRALHRRQMEPKDAFEWARVVAFGLLALRPPVRNEQFIEEVTALVGGKKVRLRQTAKHTPTQGTM